ncbi:hypothetical protein BV898_19067 [Hypsibius exemplaris]|uniref:Uncharacterized protein n=1 Tax=Hypsibius exemplaris TaxID=2072580 RepID=A0A9X6NL02_HYPEX|nr:hypothetical protein BV898_19067 [Hypsibius exemplaris]
MVAWGDITHFEWVQLPDPALTIAFDYNQTEARKDREELITCCWKEVSGSRCSYRLPGMGHLRRRAGPGFEWVPVRYDSEPTRNTTADFGFDNSNHFRPHDL